MGETLFISDLHLSGDRPPLTARFIDFLRHRVANADALYILGDLFDAWIGDDDESELANTVRSALKSVRERGVNVNLQHGNRDFLLGDQFTQDTGCEQLDETVVVDIAGAPTLLMHGDLLCTDDIDYQKARLMLRNPAFMQEFLAKSRLDRQRLAIEYRKRSGEAISQKAEDIMDASPATVADYMRRYEVTQLIHGHTHRQAIHTIEIEGKKGTRYVLGDWSENQGSVLAVRNRQLVFETV